MSDVNEKDGTTYANCTNTYVNHDGPWLCCADYYSCTQCTQYQNCANQPKTPEEKEALIAKMTPEEIEKLQELAKPLNGVLAKIEGLHKTLKGSETE